MQLNLESFFSSRLVMKNLWILNLLFLSCVLYIFIHNGLITWLNYKLEPEISIQRKSNQVSQSARKNTSPPLQDYQIIVKRNIFGGPARPPKNAPKEPEPEEYNVEQIPLAKRLNLTLMGTVVSDNSTLSRAIIFDKQKRDESIYKEGDRIKNVTLVKILRNQVIINTGKQEERLIMEMNQKTGAILKDQPEVTEEAYLEEITIDRQAIESSLNNISEIMNNAKITSYQGEDGTTGFKLDSIQNDSLFSQLGFQQDDVLVGVNNQPLKSTQQVLSLYQKLKSENQIDMKILRNGERENLRFNIQ